MPKNNEILNYQKQAAGNQAKQEAQAYVNSLRSAVDFTRMELPDIDWFVPGLIAPGLTTIAGQSKAGKSWLLLQLGLAVSAGGLFIGNRKCRKADVLYLALEDNDRRVARRLYRLGIPATRDLYIETANKLTPQNINEILDAVPFVKMLIFDTQGRYFENETTDGNDYNEMTRMVATLHAIANKRDMAIITCTHTRKNVDKEDWVNSVIGSKALVAVSDTILMLTRERESTEGKLHITGRDVDEFTIEMEHTEDWLWYDKKTDFTATEPLSEFEQFR